MTDGMREGTEEWQWDTPSSVARAADAGLEQNYDEDQVAWLVEELAGCRGAEAQLSAAAVLGNTFQSWVPDDRFLGKERRDGCGAMAAVEAGSADGRCHAWVLEEAGPALLRLAGDDGAAVEARAAALETLACLGHRFSRFRTSLICPLVRLCEGHSEALFRCLDVPAEPSDAHQDLLFHALHFLSICQLARRSHSTVLPEWPWQPVFLTHLHKLLRRLNRDPELAELDPPRSDHHGFYREFNGNFTMPQPTMDLRHFFPAILRRPGSRLLRPDVMLGEPGLVAELIRYAEDHSADGIRWLGHLARDMRWDDGGQPVLGFPWSEDIAAPVSSHRLILFTERCLEEGLGLAFVRALGYEENEEISFTDVFRLMPIINPLKRLLDPAVFSLPLRRERAEGLRAAGLEDELPPFRVIADHIDADPVYQPHMNNWDVDIRGLIDRYDDALRQPATALAAHPSLSFPIR